MERELVWQQVYRAVKTGSKNLAATRRQGHPDVYPTWVIAVCWLWACLWREPLSWAMRTLGSPKKRRLYRELGYRLPEMIPESSTVSRRMGRPDFPATLEAINRGLVGQLLTDRSCHTLITDSSPLDIPTISHDPDARFGHHGHFGYRFHTLVTHDRIVLTQDTTASNEQELAVFPRLVQRAAQAGIRCRYVAADIGYDSENAHREARRNLGGMLVAPINTRGGQPTFRRTPQRKRMWALWRTPTLRRVRKKRPEVERIYSVFKGPLGMDSLPRHIRTLPRVRRFSQGQTILYHAYRLSKTATRVA